jgi:acetyl-CoA/propionyl-CoA carboxylase carboxyl transferase subunit
MTTVIGRLGGRTVGVIANNPQVIGGVLDSAAGEKAARFVRTCDAFGIPLIVIADVTGFLPGIGQEWEGAVRRGAKLLHAFAESVVPRVTVITRKAYGGAFVAMNSKSLGATRVFAWPQAEVSVMGAVAAVRVLHRRLLADLPEEQRADMELELAAEHERVSGGVARAIEIGAVDEMIEPDKTRSAIAKVLAESEYRRGSHGNIPL